MSYIYILGDDKNKKYLQYFSYGNYNFTRSCIFTDNKKFALSFEKFNDVCFFVNFLKKNFSYKFEVE